VRLRGERREGVEEEKEGVIFISIFCLEVFFGPTYLHTQRKRKRREKSTWLVPSVRYNFLCVWFVFSFDFLALL